jgi:N-methylhydantoinase A
MRYAGQGYEMTLPVGEGPLGEADLVTLRQAFDAQHKAMFGHSAPEQPVEIVSYRVRGIGLVPAVEMPRFVPTGATLDSALRERRRVRFDGAEVDCPVYQREKIDVGATVEGPAILDQFDCTTVLCPGQVARVDDYKNLIVGMGR